jgi:hypothetical protein
MFDLDKAIEQWRAQMAVNGVKSPEVLNELESHLRDDVDQQAQSGADAARSFERAIQSIGQADILRDEFNKVGGDVSERFKQAILTLVGIPILAIHMNTTTTNIEPRWATYFKGVLFLVPALILWTLSIVFVFPKLQQICRDAGFVMPGSARALYGVMNLASDHAFLICAAVLLGLIGLEWRASQWPKYRRASVGVAVFLLNTAVLITIFVMAVMALLAVPELAKHAR